MLLHFSRLLDHNSMISFAYKSTNITGILNCNFWKWKSIKILLIHLVSNIYLAGSKFLKSPLFKSFLKLSIEVFWRNFSVSAKLTSYHQGKACLYSSTYLGSYLLSSDSTFSKKCKQKTCTGLSLSPLLTSTKNSTETTKMYQCWWLIFIDFLYTYLLDT